MVVPTASVRADETERWNLQDGTGLITDELGSSDVGTVPGTPPAGRELDDPNPAEIDARDAVFDAAVPAANIVDAFDADQDPVVDDMLTTAFDVDVSDGVGGTATGTVTAVVASGVQLPADIVFAIDESGSMGSSIADVKANVSTIAAALTAGGLDARLGLVGYGATLSHTPEDYGPHIHTVLTDVATFDVALDELVADGGTEPGFDATVLAMSDAMQFRSGAGVCMVLITDEASNGDTASQGDAIDALGARDAGFFGIIPTGSSTATAQYGPDQGSLAEVTGGAVFDISAFQADPTPVLNALLAGCVGSIVEGINLVPATAENTVGATHTVTAIVKDSLGQPVVGTQVDFEIIAGPHAGIVASAVTDALGEAAFSYVGTSVGEDTIQASFVDSVTLEVKFATATSTWIPGAQPSVGIAKAFDSESLGFGEASFFMLEVTNTGDTELIDVVVTDPVDPVLAVTGVDCGGTAVPPSQSVECTFASLAAGDSVTVKIDFEVGVLPPTALLANAQPAAPAAAECPPGYELNREGVCTSESIRPVATCWLNDGTMSVEIVNTRTSMIPVTWAYLDQGGVVSAAPGSTFVTLTGGPSVGDFYVAWGAKPTQEWWIEITDELCEPPQEVEVVNVAEVTAQSTAGAVSAEGTDSVLVTTVAADVPPEADFAWACFGLECDFTDASSDPDGTVIAWEWDFGDGTTSSEQNPTHVFAASGIYPVTLTVSDGDALTDTATYNVTATAIEFEGTLHVGDLDGASLRQGRQWNAFVAVLVVDDDGHPVDGATVEGSWAYAGTALCTTDANGSCLMEAYGVSRRFETLVIDDVKHPLLAYDPSANTDPDGDSDGTSITLRRPRR